MLSPITPDQHDRVRRCYEEGFAAHLRAPFADLLDPADGQQALVLAERERPLGLAVVRPLGDTGWTFLRYFVVDSQVRNRGLGSRLWTALTRHLDSTMLIFDVEDPQEPHCSPQEKEIRLRRIAFYERNGALLLPVTGYRTPHGDTWGPMQLMAAPLDPTLPWTVSQVVLAVYQHRWGLSPDHPTVLGTQY
ncbi:GNAT family N-acetyltransferase [Kutzneria albida]|uniref:N-acetyltransferase domain-containing protein n=1 Tax=Kutzneria albida DSM 43870 TaxID=1449976 RepID=W5WEN2_9PSEU|nr:GNAT family N-acetyltransferase [Kutzneria albida]AHH96614.1 hypothetical protein KALB_3247 [Kutzneria albida DSM 43870]